MATSQSGEYYEAGKESNAGYAYRNWSFTENEISPPKTLGWSNSLSLFL